MDTQKTDEITQQHRKIGRTSTQNYAHMTS